MSDGSMGGLVFGGILVLVGVAITVFTPQLAIWAFEFELRARKKQHNVYARLAVEYPEVFDQASGNHTSSFSLVTRAKEMRGNDPLKINTWAYSNERDAYLKRRERVYISALGGGLIVGGGLMWSAVARNEDDLAQGISQVAAGLAVALGAAVIIYSLIPYFSARASFRSKRLALASARVDDAIVKACSGRNPLQIEDLFQLNRRQLDEYQLLTRKQQRSAFLLAQVASVIAFVVLVGGVFTALDQPEPADKYLTGGLTALGSLLSSFLAATFFQSSKDANKQMNRYYLEPQRTGRLLAAERVVRAIPDASVEIKTDMIKALLAWEMPADPPVPASENKDAGSTENMEKAGAGTTSNGSNPA